jgi:hypothetical protein
MLMQHTIVAYHMPFPRPYMPTFPHSRMPTFPHAHTPTFPHTHMPTFPHAHISSHLHAHISTLPKWCSIQQWNATFPFTWCPHGQIPSPVSLELNARGVSLRSLICWDFLCSHGPKHTNKIPGRDCRTLYLMQSLQTRGDTRRESH